MLWTSIRAAAFIIAGLLVAAPPASAQTTPAPPGAPAAAAKQAPPAQKRPPAKGDGAGNTAPSGESGLRQRVEQLEEQLVDMQVVIGTLESLAKSGGGSAPAPAAARPAAGGYGASDAARLDGLETQIRALTSQIEQLADQVRAMGGTARKAEVAPPRSNDSAEGFSARREDPAAGATAAIGAAPRFGSTTVTTDAGDPIGSLLSAAPAPGGAAGANGIGNGAGPAPGIVPGQSVAVAPLPPVGGEESTGSSKQLYEKAYAHLLQQDYAAAEAAFDDFLKRFPGDTLAGNAQYWLGESFFVRGQFKAAASAFLKGYQTYGKSAKAPDSLLKLAMSLDRLGQKDAACASFAELGTRFPGASANVKTRAQAERARLGCT